MSITTLPKLWTKDEVAACLGLEPSTVARMCREKKLGYVVIGNRTRFTASHIEQYIKHRDEPEAPPPPPPPKLDFPVIEVLTIDQLRKLDDAIYHTQVGVYFLWRCEQLVYIGQSEYVCQRIQQHRQARNDPTRRYIEFDTATVLEVFWPYHLAVEAVYLRHYEPPENRRT